MAGFIPEDIINEIIDKNDIVDVISSYITLNKRGNRYVGLCPFHSEKTPSFTVTPDKNMFHCFGCGVGGTVINFIMMSENLDFVDSVKLLANRTGIDIKDEYSGSEKISRKKQIYKYNLDAAKKFRKNLLDDDAKECVEYIKKRGLNNKLVNLFGLGYSKNSFDDLYNHFTHNGIKSSDLKYSGLFSENEKGKLYDRFRNRLMFPIIDVYGNIIGFGGRTLGNDKAKYINSPETEAYNKSANLYALNLAKNTSLGYFILCEGNIDVISVFAAGFDNAIASLGTALTVQQAKLIKKYTSTVYICYDSDEAGVQATHRAIGILSSVGLKVKVIVFNNAKDADEFINKFGADAFKSIVNDAINYIEYKVICAKLKYNLDEIDDKIAFVNECADIFKDIDNQVEREVYIGKISEEYNISNDSLTAEVFKLIGKKQRDAEYAINNKSKAKGYSQNYSVLNAERQLLCLIINDYTVYNRFCEKVNNNIFTDEFHTEIYQKLKELKKTKVEISTIDLFNLVSDASKLSGVLDCNLPFDDKYKAMDELVGTLEKYREKNKNITEAEDLKRFFEIRKNLM